MEFYYFRYQDGDYEVSGVIAAKNAEDAKQGLYLARDKDKITLLRLSSMLYASGDVVVSKSTYWPR